MKVPLPRGHCIHESSIVLRVSGVPSVVTTFPPYLLKTWNLNKNLSTLNLKWKPLKWNSICSELTAPKGPGAHRDARRSGFPLAYKVSSRSWGSTAPISSADLGDPGIRKL